MMNENKNRPKQILANLVIILVSLLIGVILVEVGLAIVLPFPSYVIMPEPYVSDPILGHRFKSNAELTQNGEVFFTDSNGFRVLDPDDSPQSNDPVILFIGDSQTFGWMVSTEESFVYQTQEKLQQLGLDIRSVNVAAPGWNLWHYQAAYDHAIKLYPKTVVLVLYLYENDWEPPDYYHIEGGYMVSKYKSDAARFIPKSIRVQLSKFHTWRYFTHFWRTIRDRGNSEGQEAADESYASRWVEEIEFLESLISKTSEDEIALIVIVDVEITKVEEIMRLLSEPEIQALINVDDVKGGYLPDDHIDVDKHDALADVLVEQILTLDTFSSGE